MAITRRTFFGGGATLVAGAIIAVSAPSPNARAQPASGFIDGLGFPGGISLDENAPLLAQEVEDIRASSLVATHLTVGAVGGMPSLAAFEKIVRNIARREADIDSHPDILARVRNSADIVAAADTGRTGFIYGLQDGVSFQDDLGRLETLHQLGVRIIQPTYNRRNLLGDGCMEPADAGLSRTGHEAIEAMEAQGFLIDLSHCGRQTTADAMAIATRALSFTHTGCHALVEHPRHRTDSELRAVAQSGGVNGIFIMPYLARGKQPTAADVVRHLEHAVKVAGEDHVGIGTDGAISPTEVTQAFKDNFRKITTMRKEQGIAAPYETEEGYLFASDLNTPDRFARLAELLAERGHSAPRIDKLLGGNFLRLFRERWG